MTAETIAVYVEDLSGMDQKRLDYAYRQIVENWTPGYGVTFPPLSVIWQYANAMPANVKPSRALLERGDKPPGWDPELSKQQAKEILGRLRKAAE